MEGFVNVSVRIKPTFNDEATNSCLQVINKQPPILLVLDKSQTYHFDNIFTPDIQQEEVYNETVKTLTERVKTGYNCTVFAYGQTGTGKTYTIGTNADVTINEEESGLISRTLDDFFTPSDGYTETEISISFIEIYNEKVYDLLLPHHALPVKGFTVQGFKKLKVNNTFEALEQLKYGSKNRHTSGTKQNLNSSRSHAIFSIYYQSRSCTSEIESKLNLVDLAGSERVNKTGNQGSSFYEGVNINKGLLSLGQVMTALSTNCSHIPYRQSVITTILQDSLNKKNYVTLIACVSSSPEDLSETLQTLEFANRVKKMKNKPEINHFITQYKKENPSLFPRGLTPSKRSNLNTFETPFKKPKITLPAVQETPYFVNNSAFEVSPLLSSTMTSGSSCAQQNFSPVIRKYITAMESSIVNRLESVIKSTLRRSKRLSVRRENKENVSPRISWNKISKNLYAEPPEGRATSSPLEKSIISSNSDSFLGNQINIMENNNGAKNNQRTDDSIFLVPAPRTKKPKIQNNSVRRSSVRLQLKQHVSETQLPEGNRRRSVRLQNKQTVLNTCEKTKKKSKSPVKKNKTAESPTTLRTNKVLQLLNKGTIKELEKLHTVGAKTAEKIYLFRQLKGNFKSIADMEEMPSWTKAKFEKFLAENFLRR
ncbi:kinesin-like protein Nod [Tribolium castaneum]|uniref:Kinesin-like protein n=1 Tax=Tribolium castaneum TaxID=7070 RepID=D6WF49_TRICA|nr:PREDICTED: kinesin-like protein Nod [Tribolium castaneum]EFA00906.2 Bipolar kinesin KRP-130-like Protein [Tribolium castaneum]|eukprot:XP_008193431.1 PREDICTED: kinesin-like protein Nod [Tribolium castaneum]